MERLHKCLEITDLKDMLEKTGELYGDKPAYKFKTKKQGEFRIITHKEFRDDIKALGTALVDLGLQGKRIAVISDNRYEWEVAYLAVATGVGTIVPLDKMLPENEIASLISRSEVEAIFYSDKYDKVMKKIREAGDTNLKHYISMDLKESKEKKELLAQKDLVEKGKELIAKGDRRFLDIKIDPEVMSFMLFTSGTTAMSKAVMLSQKNICTNLMDIASVIKLVPEDIMLSFLPLHHTFECTVGFLYPIYCGASIAFCDGIRHIAENIKEYQITAMISVPALYENMYKKVMKGIEKKGKLEAVKRGIKISNTLLKFRIDMRKEIFKEIHETLGGKVRLFVSGGAALDEETERGFNELGFKIYQGYGLTETSPVIAAGNDKYVKLGSIGKVFPSLETKVINTNDQGVGEILVKGPSVMLGYYNNEEETKKVLDKDGWFHTGDLGYFDKDGYLFIAGRMKNVIVLKNGKNVYPEELEAVINKIEGVNESFVYGKVDENDEADVKVCAKLVYDKETLKKVYGVKGKEDIKEALWERVKEINKSMPTYKYIKEITITEEELIKTTTQKIKRHVELEKMLAK